MLQITVTLGSVCNRLASRRDLVQHGLPLWAHRCTAYTVKTEYECTLKVDADHEHRLYNMLVSKQAAF